MKHHEHGHDHAHEDPHHHGHGGREHQETTAAVNHPSTDTAPPGHPRESGNPSTAAAHGTDGSTHHHGLDSRFRGNDGAFGKVLVMTSSLNRVLGASVLIALLWLAVAWAVSFID